MRPVEPFLLQGAARRETFSSSMRSVHGFEFETPGLDAYLQCMARDANFFKNDED